METTADPLKDSKEHIVTRQYQEKLELLGTQINRLRDVEKINIRLEEENKRLKAKVYEMNEQHDSAKDAQKMANNQISTDSDNMIYNALRDANTRKEFWDEIAERLGFSGVSIDGVVSNIKNLNDRETKYSSRAYHAETEVDNLNAEIASLKKQLEGYHEIGKSNIEVQSLLKMLDDDSKWKQSLISTLLTLQLQTKPEPNPFIP